MIKGKAEVGCRGWRGYKVKGMEGLLNLYITYILQ